MAVCVNALVREMIRPEPISRPELSVASSAFNEVQRPFQLEDRVCPGLQEHARTIRRIGDVA